MLVVVLAAGVPEAGGGTARGATPSAAAVPTAIVDRYLSVRPPLGDVTVVNISGESTSRRLLAATLQGVVNRTAARIYLVGARTAEQDQRWIDDYVARGLVHVVADDTLDQALAAFAGEVSGFVVASYAEPWTINTATTVAAARGGVVATAAEVPTLLGLGLTQLDDHVGRWSDAATAYEDTAAAERSHLAYPGLAIEQTGLNAPRDFLVQQGIMAVFTRPSDPDYDRVMALLDGYPPDHPVYGYVADTGAEEVQAIVRLSQQGRFLVPTDTTDNLSFHLAVAATAPRGAPRAGRASRRAVHVGHGERRGRDDRRRQHGDPRGVPTGGRSLGERAAGHAAARLGPDPRDGRAAARDLGPLRVDSHAGRRDRGTGGPRLRRARA